MSRVIESALQTEIEASTYRHVTLASIGFTSSVIRLCSIALDIVWDGNTYLGNGWLKPIRAINETPDVRAVGVEIPLVGVSSTLISLALLNVDQNLDAYVYLGALDASNDLVSDPLLIWKGKVDSTTIEDSAENPTITIQCESYLARLNRPQNFRYTNENQKALFAGDRGFEYVAKLEDWNGFWGKAERPKWLRRKRLRAQPPARR